MEIDYKNGIKLELSIIDEKSEINLFIDDKDVMSTKQIEHYSMKKAVEECPENARVFIGGLGFGLILKYLAESKKAKEVIVCEIDERIITLFENEIRKYLKKNYPEFNFILIHGDAYEEIKKNGLFDWIYIDLSIGGLKDIEKLSKQFLTNNGKYSSFKEYHFNREKGEFEEI